MSFEEIIDILKSTKTDYQKAADLHAAIQTATRPSVKDLQPMKQRKARTPKTPRQGPAIATQNGEAVGRVGDEAA